MPPLSPRLLHTLRSSSPLLSLLLLLLLAPTLLLAAEDPSSCINDEAAAPPSPSDNSPMVASGTPRSKSRFWSRKRSTDPLEKHILLVSINELSHIKPLTALGRELLRRGHQVSFVAPESCLMLGSNGSSCLLDTKTWMSTYLPKATFYSAGPALTSVEKEAETPTDIGRAVLYALQTVSDVNEALLTRLLDTFALSPTAAAAAAAAAAKKKNKKDKKGKAQQAGGVQTDDKSTKKLPAPDMMVVDFLTTAAVDAAEALGVPLVVNNPFPICHDLTEPQGIMVPVHAFPAPLRSLKTFKGRVANLINHLLWLGVGLYAARLRNLMRGRHGLPSLPYLEQLSFKASEVEGQAWILQNTVFGLEVPRVVDPRTHMVGPLLMLPGQGGEGCVSGKGAKDCKAAKNLLDTAARKGRNVIYVNLAEPLSPAPLIMVQATLAALSSDQISQHFDILWVIDDYSQKHYFDRPIPAHMVVVTAANHLATLTHPSVKLTMSQSSLSAVSEALWYGVPILGLPLRGYDRGACTLAQDAGAAQCLLPSGRRTWTTAANVVTAVMEMVPMTDAHAHTHFDKQTPLMYQHAAGNLSVIMQAAGGVPWAVDLIQLAMDVGLTHLHTPKLEIGWGMGSTWLSGSMVDVRLVLFLLILLIYWTLALFYRLGRRLERWVNYLNRPPKTQENDPSHPPAPTGAPPLSPSMSAPPMFGGGGGGGSGVSPQSRGGGLGPPGPAPGAFPQAFPPRDRPSPSYRERGGSGSGGNGGGNGVGGSGGGGARDRPPLPPRPPVVGQRE